MSTMTIRNLDDSLKQRLRIRAAQHNRSMEEEARDILRSNLCADTSQPSSLVKSIHARIEPLGGVELDLAPREPPSQDRAVLRWPRATRAISLAAASSLLIRGRQRGNSRRNKTSSRLTAALYRFRIVTNPASAEHRLTGTTASLQGGSRSAATAPPGAPDRPTTCPQGVFVIH